MAEPLGALACPSPSLVRPVKQIVTFKGKMDLTRGRCPSDSRAVCCHSPTHVRTLTEGSTGQALCLSPRAAGFNPSTRGGRGVAGG